MVYFIKKLHLKLEAFVGNFNVIFRCSFRSIVVIAFAVNDATFECSMVQLLDCLRQMLWSIKGLESYASVNLPIYSIDAASDRG